MFSEFDQIFEFLGRFYIISNIKYHGIPSSESRADSCERADGRTERGHKTSKRFYAIMLTRLKKIAWFNLALSSHIHFKTIVHYIMPYFPEIQRE
jgi:hypothetical protein